MKTRSQTKALNEWRAKKYANIVAKVKIFPKKKELKVKSVSFQIKEETEAPDYVEDDSGPYEVNIQFDEASNAWKANKISIGKGQYEYITPPQPTAELENITCTVHELPPQQNMCNGFWKTGKKCTRIPFYKNEFCYWHNTKNILSDFTNGESQNNIIEP